MIRVIHSDMLEAIPRLVAEGVVCDACVTDAPYHLTSGNIAVDYSNYGPRTDGGSDRGSTNRAARKSGFMGQQWDGGDIAFRPETWATVATILRPGGFLVAFGGTRTYHRLACAIEDGGFIIQDCILWLYATGFPKRRDMLKPAVEMICLAYKPGGKRTMQIDECRILPEGQQWEGEQSLCASCAAAVESRERHGTPGTEASTATSNAAQTLSARDMGNRPVTAITDIGCSDGTTRGFTDTNLSISASGEPQTGQSPSDLRFTTEMKIAATTRLITCASCQRLITADFILKNTFVEKMSLPRGESSSGPAGRDGESSANRRYTERGSTDYAATPGPRGGAAAGRWPANLAHDGSDEVLAAFGEDRRVNRPSSRESARLPGDSGSILAESTRRPLIQDYADTGSAARFFFSSKAGKIDRWGSRHPTVKNVELMKWLVALVTPSGGTCIDPFAGSGTTGVAALATGRNAILIERESTYHADILERMAHYEGSGRHSLASKGRQARPRGETPLFDQPYDQDQDAHQSYLDAVSAIGAKVKAGAPVPDFFLPDKPEAAE